MKKYLLTLLCLSFLLPALAQKTVFYQASYLRNLLEETGSIPIDNVTASALDNLYDTRDLTALVKALNENPFTIGYKYEEKTAGGVSAFSSAAGIGGLDVTTLANGVSDFLIKRAKQELNIAFFARFKKLSEEHPEFEVLFPKTASNLSALLDFAYPQMLPALRKGFLEDLKQVAYKLEDVMDLPRYRESLKKLPEIRICLKSIKLVHQLESGLSSPADLLAGFAALPEWNEGTSSLPVKNIGASLKIVSLISESIRAEAAADKKIWVPSNELRKLLNDPIFLKIYLSLLYRKAEKENIQFYKGGHAKTFAAELAEHKDRIGMLNEMLSAFFSLTSDINSIVSDIKTKEASGTKASNDDYYNYINASIDFIVSANNTFKNLTELDISQDYFLIARKSNEIYKDVYTQNYAQLFGDMVGTFDLILKQVDKQEPFKSLAEAKPITEYSGIEKKSLLKMADIKSDFSEINDKKLTAIIDDHTNFNSDVALAISHYRLKQFREFLRKLQGYGLFMADMVTAKTSEEVSQSLENAALPVGSSSVKKHTTGNMAIQAYLGAYFTNNSNSYNAWTSKFGVIAPIGVSYTPSFLSWGKGGAVSIFTSLLDLGAIVDYKLRSDSTVSTNGTGNKAAIAKEYKIELGQIFSPGAFLVYGFFADLPISLGFGGQYGPGLSKIDVTGNTTVTNNPTWRWSAFLSVDIPLFNLYNRPRKR